MATTYDKASLVMIPSGYKDDKLYSVKPTDGSGDFTFSRDGAGASPATRVNASGLIEKGRENILTYSNDFSNAAWVKVGVTLTTGQADPFGGNNATKVDFAGGVNAYLAQGNLGSTNVRTRSIWMRADSAVQVSFGDGISANPTNITTSWVRYEAFISTIPVSGLQIDNYAGLASPQQAISVYVYAAQVEDGLVATDYIETTTAPVSAGLLGDMPRLDYSGGATCPSLLLEPSRVNLFIQSEYFETAWSKANVTLTANDTSSPEGVTNAYKMEATGTGGKVIYEDIALTNGTFTISIFVKKGANTGLFSLSDGYSSTKLNVDLDAETATADNANTLSPFIEPFNDGWFRIGYSMAVTASQAQPALYLLDSSGNQNYTAAGETIYIYGAMIETGSYPTSYIPTYGSASGRAVDSCVKTGITSLIGQSEGTLFIEGTYQATNTQYTRLVALKGSGTTYQNVLFFQDLQNGDFNLNITDASASSVGSVTFTHGLSDGDTYKIAIAYATNDIVVYMNGTSRGTDTSYTPIAFSDMRLQYTDIEGLTINKQALLFKTRLTNAELAALTA